MTKEELIKRFKNVHGDKYDYSNVDFNTINDKVKIICPHHGEFIQTARQHYRGQGCPLCGFEKTKNALSFTKEVFIEKANEIHHNKYDYSKVVYINSKTPVCIICPIHGEFWQTPEHHLIGGGCKKCNNRLNDKDFFIEKFEKLNLEHIHLPDDLVYKNNKTKIKAFCDIHGYFYITPNNLLNGHSCPECGKEKIRKSKTKSTEIFINEAKLVHNNKYDYSKTQYVSGQRKVCIICPEHGEFWQTPEVHLRGCGCPVCKQSHLEKMILNFLKDNNIVFEYQKKFVWLGRQSLDFYLPEYKIGIECQGEQHFIGWRTKNKTLSTQRLFDKTKKEKCDLHEIKIIYFTTNQKRKTFLKNKIYHNCDEIDKRIRKEVKPQ